MKKIENKHCKRFGFTLLELMAVMAIIVGLSVVVIGSYSGIMNSIKANAGARALLRAATLGKQHAVLDGDRVYLWVTGPNTFLLVRKGGTITMADDASRTPPYLTSEVHDAHWVFDEFSDMGSYAQTFVGTEQMTDQQVRDFFTNDEKVGLLWFDMTKNRSATVKYPSFYYEQYGAWCVGFDQKDIASGTFVAGNLYGRVIYQEQKLPDGYYFVDSLYDLDDDDVFVSGNNLYFEPDGTADAESGNTMILKVQKLVGNQLEEGFELVVDNGGQIRIK